MQPERACRQRGTGNRHRTGALQALRAISARFWSAAWARPARSLCRLGFVFLRRSHSPKRNCIPNRPKVLPLPSRNDSVAKQRGAQSIRLEAFFRSVYQSRKHSPNGTRIPDRAKLLPLLGERAGVRADFLSNWIVPVSGSGVRANFHPN